MPPARKMAVYQRQRAKRPRGAKQPDRQTHETVHKNPRCVSRNAYRSTSEVAAINGMAGYCASLPETCQSGSPRVGRYSSEPSPLWLPFVTVHIKKLSGFHQAQAAQYRQILDNGDRR